jgi:uncharacterized membrane protein HdeD (DUF308 family)
MPVRSHSNVLAAGLILIVLGLIFLVENFYTPFSAWRLIARYWPVILIIVGAKKIFEYFSWQQNPPEQDQEPSKE